MSKNKKSVYLLGYSGHSYSVIDALISNKITISGYFDKKKYLYNPFNLTYFGEESNDSLKEIIKNDFIFPCVGSNLLRKKLWKLISILDLNELSVIHENAYVSNNVTINNSSVVCNGALINPNVSIGKCCIINTGAIIEHDCIVEDFAHISSGAVLAGNVKIGKLSFIGANATIKEGITIGENTIIGAGSVVISNIPNNSVYVGNPAKYLRENEE